MVPAPALTKNASPVAPLIAPVVMVKVPPMAVRLTALALLVEVRLSIVPLTGPVLRASAWPLPWRVTLLIVSVPNDVPMILAPVVFPIVKPVTVFVLARVIEFVLAAVVPNEVLVLAVLMTMVLTVRLAPLP